MSLILFYIIVVLNL